MKIPKIATLLDDRSNNVGCRPHIFGSTPHVSWLLVANETSVILSFFKTVLVSSFVWMHLQGTPLEAWLDFIQTGVALQLQDIVERFPGHLEPLQAAKKCAYGNPADSGCIVQVIHIYIFHMQSYAKTIKNLYQRWRTHSYGHDGHDTWGLKHHSQLDPKYATDLSVPWSGRRIAPWHPTRFLPNLSHMKWLLYEFYELYLPPVILHTVPDRPSS